jgi:hypothetical protein
MSRLAPPLFRRDSSLLRSVNAVGVRCEVGFFVRALIAALPDER